MAQRDALHPELLRSYCRNHRYESRAIPVLAAIAALVTARWAPWSAALGWYISVIAATFLADRVLERCEKAEIGPGDGQLRRWELAVGGARVALLSIWASITWWAWRPGDIEVQIVLVAILCFVVITNSVLSSPYVRLFHVEAVPTVIAGGIALLGPGSVASDSLAGLGLVFVGVTLALCHRFHASAVETLRLQRELGAARDRAEQASSALESLATTDELTGVLNRRAFLERADRELSRASRYEHPMSLMLLDADRFKEVNDHGGHAAGDSVLETLAATLAEGLRCTDLLARFGGDEFVILLPETESDTALKVAERLRQKVRGVRVPLGGREIALSVSIGVTRGSGDTELSALLEAADAALYAAKAEGRNRVVCTREATAY